jgi:hypothetical protein
MIALTNSLLKSGELANCSLELFVMSKAAFQTKHRERDRFVSRVLKEPKIFLIGDAGELENLVKTGQLKAHPVDAREIEQLLVAARRNLADARVTSISTSPALIHEAALSTILPR